MSDETTTRGELFILSAPSGTGKTTLIQSMLQGGLANFGGLAFSVSHTTRKPRAGEIDGKDYHFVDHATFQSMIAGDRFLEWAEVHNNYYGTSFDEVLPRMEQGIDVLMDIDVQGAERVLARYPEAHSIFIMPPSYDVLDNRLHRRGLDSEQEIARRLAVSLWEIRRYDRYRYVIINDDAHRASDVLAAIILEKRHHQDRMRGRVNSILKDFQDRVSS
ncbi:MAG TPA: guanylate kinase [Thermoanaerobaculia bacterium]|jgi:guanylate kinase|nr:guanylate kinase [Thermoanaerobaculia bacterium]